MFIVVVKNRDIPGTLLIHRSHRSKRLIRNDVEFNQSSQKQIPEQRIPLDDPSIVRGLKILVLSTSEEGKAANSCLISRSELLQKSIVDSVLDCHFEDIIII
jgi:hypothetical protein